MTEWQTLIGTLIARPAAEVSAIPDVINPGHAKMAALEASNQAAVLAHIRKAKNGITRPQIVMATGLSITTVARHVKRMHFEERVAKLPGAKVDGACLWGVAK